MEKCENCCSMIEVQSYQLHTLHCARFLFLCTCGQMISTREKDVHLLNSHYKTTCHLCNDQVEYWMKQSKSHKCLVPLIECSICQLYILPLEYSGHYEACKSRTTQCPDCKNYYTHSEIKKHSLSNCMPIISEPKKTSQNTQKNRQIKKKKKKSKWTSLGSLSLHKAHVHESQYSDHQLAEDIFEEFINSEIAEEEKKIFFTRF